MSLDTELMLSNVAIFIQPLLPVLGFLIGLTLVVALMTVLVQRWTK